MSNHKDAVRRGWAKFLNREELRDNLLAASLFLAAFEMLKTSVIEPIRNFLCFEFKDGKRVVSEDYRVNCLKLDNNPFIASLLWLKQMVVINDSDLTLANNIRRHRNELAHELPKFLATSNIDINIRLIIEICQLITKIDRWWIREVEMAANQDFDGVVVADAQITSGNMLFMQMLLQTAVGEDSDELWKMYIKVFGEQNEEDPVST